jgi:hypothetical protein
MASKSTSMTLTDHDEIQQWAEERDAKPSCVRGTGDKGDIGILRLDFPGYSGADSLQEIGWDDWLEKFDERGLALLVQETTADGERSNFNKLISRKGSAKSSGGRGRASAGRRGNSSSSRSTATRTGSRSAGRSRGTSTRTAAKRTSSASAGRKRKTSSSTSAKSGTRTKATSRRSTSAKTRSTGRRATTSARGRKSAPKSTFNRT